MKLIYSLSIFLLLTQASFSAEKVGQVLALEGTASAIDADSKTRNLELKSPIFMNDKMVTAEKSKVQVIFEDDTVISQGEKSELTIDEYVYDPQSSAKEDVSCSVGAAKGVFRVVTGKITKMNPDRFKVKTKMATIGIRGCEVGLRAQGNKADVFVIGLHGKENVVVDVPASPNGDAQQVVVNKSGSIVTFSPDAGLGQRGMTKSDETGLLVDVTPDGADPTPEQKGDSREQTFDADKNANQGGGSDGNKNDGKDGTADGNAGAGNDNKDSGTDTGTGSGTDADPATGTDSGTTTDTGTGTDPVDPAAVTDANTGTGTGTDVAVEAPTGTEPVEGTTPVVGELPPPPATDTVPTDFDTMPVVDSGDMVLPPPTIDSINVEPVMTDPGAIPQPIEETVYNFDQALVVNPDGSTAYDPSLAPPPDDPNAATAPGSEIILADSGSGSTYTMDSTGVLEPIVPEPPPPTDPTLPTDPNPTDPLVVDPNAGGTTPPASQFVAMGSGVDWDWGVWEVNGVPDSVSFTGNAVPAFDFDNIVAGVQAYNLTGAGAAGAILREGAYSVLVQGTCSINLQVPGGNTTPTWNGSFSMQNGSPNMLTFSASGIIQPGNMLTGSPISYNMIVNGSGYNSSSITFSEMQGSLAGPGTGPTPITGIFGNFLFDHGGAASANGGFGTDLN